MKFLEGSSLATAFRKPGWAAGRPLQVFLEEEQDFTTTAWDGMMGWGRVDGEGWGRGTIPANLLQNLPGDGLPFSS